MGSTSIRIGAVVAVVVAAAVVAVLLIRNHDSSSSDKRAPAQAATAAHLAALPQLVGHTVYWAGTRAGYTYELTRTSSGKIYIRYLPPGVKIGDSRADFLTVGTYPVSNAVTEVRGIAKRTKATTVSLSGGGVGVLDPKHPESFYLAYPGSPYEIEVFDPTPRHARQIALAGNVVALGSSSGGSDAGTIAPAAAATLASLRELATSSKHQVYWLGPRSSSKLEQTETSDGRVFVRYLPKTAAIGVRASYLTVGSYPVTDPTAEVKAIAARLKVGTFPVKGGGIGVIDKTHPTSVYLALPGSDVQVEIFDPSAGVARSLATSGRVKSVS